MKLRVRLGRRKKPLLLQAAEYVGVRFGFGVMQLTPMPVARWATKRFGDILYLCWPRRRRIAMKNVALAMPEVQDPKEIRRITLASCHSFLITALEMVKFRSLYERPDAAEIISGMVPGFVEKMEAVRRLYDSTGGFVVVAPHLGNWEILLHVAEVVGIPTTTVVRPLDNPWLERLIYRYRTKHQQELVPKRNALMHLRRALRRGQCVAVMGDQRAGKRGIMAPFFGRPVATHRTAAILAREFNRPIMVLAGCRTATGFEGLMSDPIWPDLNAPEEQEILRLTTLVNRQMEEFIRRYPEQYLWAHDRWRDAAPEPVPTSPA